jgi:hypothetical protein
LASDPFADFPQPAPPIEQIPSKAAAEIPAANVSSAELNMLLQEQVETPAEEASAAEALRAEMAADAGGAGVAPVGAS